MQLNTPNLRAPLACGLLAAALLLVNAAPALAYTGPGLGLGAIGTALGVVAALLLMLISIVWYPFKRMLRRMRGEKTTRSAAAKRP
jgi:cellobiose-specific phosphotransferase system component IIC